MRVRSSSMEMSIKLRLAGAGAVDVGPGHDLALEHELHEREVQRHSVELLEQRITRLDGDRAPQRGAEQLAHLPRSQLLVPTAQRHRRMAFAQSGRSGRPRKSRVQLTTSRLGRFGVLVADIRPGLASSGWVCLRGLCPSVIIVARCRRVA